MADSVPGMSDDCVETMEQLQAELGLNEDSVHSDIVPLSNGIITESMVIEEKVLLKQAAEENKKQLEENNSKENEMSKEERFKQLQHLLGRSKFYTKYLQAKISARNAVLEKKIKKEKDAANLKTEVQRPLQTRSTAVENNTTATAKCDEQPLVTLKRGARNDSNTKALKIPKLELQRLEDCYPENLVGCPVEAYSKTSIKLEPSGIEAPVLLTGGVMRSYQLEGYHWLKVLYENGINGILGDEMGLGKTLQCISLLAHLIEHGVTGPFLICAPLSTLPNWVTEFQRFTPKIPVILYHGSLDERVALRTKFRKLHSFDGFSALPVIITSYEIIIRDCKALGQYKWKYIVVDEGHRIKNMNCLLIKRLKELHSINRLLLTGTPLQNNLAELWSLLNFILPELFDNLKIFESWFEVRSMSEEGSNERIIALEQENHILATLHEILAPFLLRRVKSDVELFIPPKRELLVYAPLTPKQQTYYKAIVDKTIRNIVGNHMDEEKETELPKKRKPNLNSKSAYGTPYPISNYEINLHLLNSMMQFRKCVNHPYLFEYPLDPATQDYLINEELVATAGKIQVLDILMKKLIETNHKILIFSQMVKMLDIIHDFCYLRKYRFVRLDGSKKLLERQDAIKEFNENPDVHVFLLSTRAGGLGLNLTAADTVIIYDSDWNPQCDLQAMDRCHRIGQTKPVVVYRLVTENTIDQKIVMRAAAKRKLEKMVIHKDKFKKGVRSEQRLSAISPSELLELLKSTDHDGVFSSNKKEVFTKEELDMLLDRNFKSKQQISDASHGRVKVIEENETPTSA